MNHVLLVEDDADPERRWPSSPDPIPDSSCATCT
jgi:hypothetical protein